MGYIDIIEMKEGREGEGDLSNIGEQSDNSELIATLRRIIAEQESRIAQLEEAVHKWERKYRQQMTVEPPKDHIFFRHKADDPSYLAFAKELSRLQLTYDRNIPKSPPADQNILISFPEVLQLVERLYQQLGRWEGEAAAKGRMVETHQTTIDGLQRRMEGYRVSF